MQRPGCCLTQSCAEVGSEGWGGWIPEWPAEWRRCPVTLMYPDQEQLKRFDIQERWRLHVRGDHLMTTITARSTTTRHNALASALFLLATKTWTAEKFWSIQHRCFYIWGSQVSNSFFMLEFCLEIAFFFYFIATVMSCNYPLIAFAISAVGIY